VSEQHGPKSLLARTWPTGSMLLWVAVLLALFLIVRYM
jgi:multicomponent Na+:H+ antiporter subunit D